MAASQHNNQLVAQPRVEISHAPREARIHELIILQYRYMSSANSLPKHIKTPAHLRMAYELLKPLALNVAANLRNTWWNPSTNTMELCNDAPLAACQMRRSEYVGTVEYHVDRNHKKRGPDNFIGFKAEGAVCIAKRRDKEDVYAYFTLDEARQAGLLTKDNWRKYPEAMLLKRARAKALRLQWGDVLQGVGIYEADEFVEAPRPLRDTALAESMLAAPRPAEKPAPKPEPVEAEAEAEPYAEPAKKAPPAEPATQDELDSELDVLFGEEAEADEAREPGGD